PSAARFLATVAWSMTCGQFPRCGRWECLWCSMPLTAYRSLADWGGRPAEIERWSSLWRVQPRPLASTGCSLKPIPTPIVRPVTDPTWCRSISLGQCYSEFCRSEKPFNHGRKPSHHLDFGSVCCACVLRAVDERLRIEVCTPWFRIGYHCGWK